MTARITTRRQFLTLVSGALVAGGAAAQLEPNIQALRAAALEAAIRKITGGKPVRAGKVKLQVPPLVDNGNTVPLSVSVQSPMTAADHVAAIHVLTEKNPQPYVVSAYLGPRAGRASITTRAERHGEHWVLRGVKTWVTNAPVADLLTVAAKTSGERGLKNIALFLLDRSTMRGITLGKPIDKIAVRASVTGEILLEDVEVPDEHLLGGETGGAEKVGTILAEIRIMTAALSTPASRSCAPAAGRTGSP